MDKVEALLRDWPDWPRQRMVHPIEAEKLPDSIYLFLIIFFTIFSALMVLLFVLIIWIGIYKSVTDSGRHADMKRLVEV